MVYVRGDGTVSANPPLHERIISFFVGIVTFTIFFFKSLVGLETTKPSRNSGSNSFFGGFGGGSGGGGGGGGPGGRPFGPGGGKPNFRSMSDINKPTVSAGGCPGGSCGM